jgi:hypothetical protein
LNKLLFSAIDNLIFSLEKNDMVMGMSTTTGYDGQGGYMNDWNIYPSYLNANGGIAQVCISYSGYWTL